MKQITEVCPHCNKEQTFEVKDNIHWAFCKDCGKTVYFCDECMYLNQGKCNPMDEISYCYKYQKEN